MIVHLPSNVSLAANSFVTPPPRRHKPPPATPAGRPSRTGLVDPPAAGHGPVSEVWSTPPFRPSDSTVIAYRVVPAYEADVRFGSSSEESRQHRLNETDRRQHNINDMLSFKGSGNLTSEVKDATAEVRSSLKVEPAATCDSSSPVKSNTSVRGLSASDDCQISASATQRHSGGVHVAASTASQVSATR